MKIQMDARFLPGRRADDHRPPDRHHSRRIDVITEFVERQVNAWAPVIKAADITP